MKNNKITGWICGLSQGEQKYKINGVTYTVASRFESPQSENTIKSRFSRTITNDFIDLTDDLKIYKMADEYVCSAAGKED
ncbi:MAG TPA: hypothetical protein VFD52_04255 [Clostridia bacterium]|nr:hypothetical protein [Clostridia bacterium]